MDVAGQDPEIRLVLDQFGPVASLEEVPAMPVAACPPIGVRREEQLHSLGEVGARRFEDQVEVIGQADEGIQRPSRPPDRALQASHQPHAIGIVLDDVLPAVTPCHDMIDGIGVLDLQDSRASRPRRRGSRPRRVGRSGARQPSSDHPNHEIA